MVPQGARAGEEKGAGVSGLHAAGNSLADDAGGDGVGGGYGDFPDSGSAGAWRIGAHERPRHRARQLALAHARWRLLTLPRQTNASDGAALWAGITISCDTGILP